jgi:hypothetical protein
MSNNHLDIEQQLSTELEVIQPPDALYQKIRSRILKENSLKSKKKVYLALSFTLIVLLIFGGGFVSQTFAEILKKIPIVGVIYHNNNSDIGLKNAKNLGLTENVEKSITSNNLTLTITQTFYDGQNLSVTYRLENSRKETWNIPPSANNGTTHLILDMGSFDSKINGSHNYGGFSEQYDIKGAREYEGILNIYPMDLPKEDHFSLELAFTEIQGVSGNWDFKIPISKDKTNELGKTFSHKYKVNAFGGEFIIKSISFAPSGIGLDTETIMDKGKGINYYFSIVGAGPDNGPSGHTKDLGNGKELVTNHFPFPPMKEIPKSVTLMVYNSKDTSQTVKFTVPLKEDDTVKDSNKNSITTLQPTYVKVEKHANDANKKPKVKPGRVLGVGKTTFPTANGLSNTVVIQYSKLVGTTQRYFDYRKQKMKYSEKNQVVPVNDIDLSQFPQLKGYKGMLKMDGTKTTEYYTLKTFKLNNEMFIREIFIYMVPGSTREELMKIIDKAAIDNLE